MKKYVKKGVAFQYREGGEYGKHVLWLLSSLFARPLQFQYKEGAVYEKHVPCMLRSHNHLRQR